MQHAELTPRENFVYMHNECVTEHGTICDVACFDAGGRQGEHMCVVECAQMNVYVSRLFYTWCIKVGSAGRILRHHFRRDRVDFAENQFRQSAQW